MDRSGFSREIVPNSLNYIIEISVQQNSLSLPYMVQYDMVITDFNTKEMLF